MSHTCKLALSSLFLLLLFSACGEKEKAPLIIPAAYDGASFAINTATQDAVRAQLEALVAETKKGRTTGVVVDYSTLSQLYNAGNPSVKSITTTYYADRLDGAGNWFEQLSQASGGAYIPGTPAGQGGTYGAYLFEENGLEIEQMVEKGLFGAALYNHAVALMQGNLTPATADQLVRIFGAHPDFPNTPTAANAANPDKFMANYAARRDKNDGTGMYSQMEAAFIELQAALKAGGEYNDERDRALATIRLTWEKINAATVINYCHSVISTMSATNPTDANKAGALHAYGECVGFIHGWRTIPQAYKQITDSEIDEVLTLLNAPYNGVPTAYKFITDPLNELPKMTQIISKLKAVYGFSDQEIEDFRKNWVAEQGR
ncbi:MAG: DUF4856 domain-containing protein [Saprospiraceae bacterium]|nr:DUF4856 domain-containing protein [Saprospiraceae bacterium]